MSSGNLKTFIERVVREDTFIMSQGSKVMHTNKAIYVLTCSHREIGPIGAQEIICKSCKKIVELGLDYHTFRVLGGRDPLLDLRTDQWDAPWQHNPTTT